ncbi:acyl-CoA N-acyltransferase [Triangularia setosa]|uniref:Acyl-CoA N-acyltransferase n=1 Tax=Triangularia setosa TaxID=2587417 RepID=A0AAN6WHC8_9PEZI|nr:acyl-CoA N-acyltransferase [Podospora setosa]
MLTLREAIVADSPRIGVIGRDSFGPTLGRILFPAHLHHRALTDAATEEAEWRAARNTRRMKDGKKTFVVVDKLEDGSEQIVGYAQWETPESLPATPAPDDKTANEAEINVLPPSLDQETLGDIFKLMGEVTERALGKEGHSQMWYLMILGVDPAQKRRGIGKMLVNYGLEQAAKEKRDAFLIATPEGKYLYSSLGFEQVGEEYLVGDVPHYSMLWKRPREEGEVLN